MIRTWTAAGSGVALTLGLAAPLESTGEPGIFEGRVDLSMKGTWQTTLTFQDQAGPQQAIFSIQAQ